MKAIYIFLLVSGIAFCQKTKKPKPDQARFEALVELAYQKQNQEALDGFRQFMVDFPDSDLKPRAHYNVAYLLRETYKMLESAKVFEEILSAGYSDTEAYGGIMEQYALYKHRSAEHLAEIYLYMGNYDTAEKYVVMFDKEYPYEHFCGNELAANEIYTARMYAEVYLGQGKTDKAIQTMLPHLFSTGLASNAKLLAVLEKALEKRYSAEELKALSQAAFSSFKYVDYGNASITLLGKSVTVYAEGAFQFSADNTSDSAPLLRQAVKQHPILSKYL